ncbi:MAG: exodeoxyribonuclease VII small subunit [Akkermansia sp.]|nr:exodeoxyribonuclease VII small subunit [Akkermansia sp.]
MSPRRPGEKNLTFEQSMARLEEIAARLENPETGLEETIALVEEGRRLVAAGRKLLDEAELKIRTLDAPEQVPTPVPTTKTDNEDGFSLI